MGRQIELNDGDAAVVIRVDGTTDMVYEEQEEGDELNTSTLIAGLLLICIQTPSILKQAEEIFDELIK